MTWIENLSAFLTLELWAGAILGVVVGGISAVAARLSSIALRRTELGLLLGPMSRDDHPCAIYVREMESVNGEHFSLDPQFVPAQPPRRCSWINMRGVLPREDVWAAAELTGLLGEAGRRTGVTWRSIQRDWDNWSEAIIAVGGHYKSERALEVAASDLAVLRQGSVFELKPSGATFGIVDAVDHGLVCRTYHPTTQAPVLVVLGHSGLGTEAAAQFFRRNARVLGRLYARRRFAGVVSVNILDGKESTRLVALTPTPPLGRRLLHPLAWYSWRHAFRRGAA